MKKLKILIKGETINLSIPTVDFARKSDWYKWLNDVNITKFLGTNYKNHKNTPRKQEKYFIEEKKKRFFLIISTKKNIYKGVVSLSYINKKKHTCSIALITDVNIEPELSAYAGIEAIARLTDYAFKKMNIKKIYGAGHIKISNWQQRMELFGYRIDSIKKNDYLNSKKMDDSHLVSCSHCDYVTILKKRKFFWDSLEKMKKRFKKLPKNSFKKQLMNFLDNKGSKYYTKLFNL